MGGIKVSRRGVEYDEGILRNLILGRVVEKTVRILKMPLEGCARGEHYA